MLFYVQYDQRCSGERGAALAYTFENTSGHQVILVVGEKNYIFKCTGVSENSYSCSLSIFQ